MRVLSTILDIIFPVYCLSCGQKGEDLCLKCLIDSPGAERECAEWIFPLFDYRHPPVKKAVHLLKYRGKKRLTRVFAESLYGRILEELADLSVMENFTDPLLIPIPLSPARYRERGFNQAELICTELLNLEKTHIRHGVYVQLGMLKNVLVKPKDTVHQAHIENRAERLKNIIGSFAVKNDIQIKNRNIILIDDVTTTGATLTEARKMLKSAGARKVIAFTVAH